MPFPCNFRWICPFFPFTSLLGRNNGSIPLVGSPSDPANHHLPPWCSVLAILKQPKVYRLRMDSLNSLGAPPPPPSWTEPSELVTTHSFTLAELTTASQPAKVYSRSTSDDMHAVPSFISLTHPTATLLHCRVGRVIRVSQAAEITCSRLFWLLWDDVWKFGRLMCCRICSGSSGLP